MQKNRRVKINYPLKQNSEEKGRGKTVIHKHGNLRVRLSVKITKKNQQLMIASDLPVDYYA